MIAQSVNRLKSRGFETFRFMLTLTFFTDLCNGANRVAVSDFCATLLTALVALMYNYMF